MTLNMSATGRVNVFCRQSKERHARLSDFAAWYGTLQRVQAQQQHFQQQQDIAQSMWEMFVAFGGKPLQDQQDSFDEMKEDAATFSKVPFGAYASE